MDILLLNPRLNTWSPNAYMPLGLAYVAAVLEQVGHNITIIDLNVSKVSDKELQKQITNADIVGITGIITEYQEILKLIGIVKKTGTKAKVILGGGLATALPREILQISPVDFIVIGEGEQTVTELVAAIAHDGDFRKIRGIAYREDGQIIFTEPVIPIPNPDTIPFPARHLLKIEKYPNKYLESYGLKIKEINKIRSTVLISSRGCPYSCTFCFKGMWGNKWRARSPENIVEEIELLHREYNMNGFIFYDDAQIEYTNIEPKYEFTTADTYNPSGTTGNDTITIVDGGIKSDSSSCASGCQTLEIQSASFENIFFANNLFLALEYG